ncbi:flagellar hook-length control protein FliK [Paracoccaceae bacterium]|nr:flagellar hook-length control protein FliK [Paracoccaceae bacterium]MDC3205349.1 flagellar hook-length control protein FliK [Paracoccaceae bacterium]
MTVIGNNSANNSNSLANTSPTGVLGADGNTAATSFLDVLSMLSSQGEVSASNSKSDLLMNELSSETEPSTLALLQKFLDQEKISTPLFGEESQEGLSGMSVPKFIDFLNREITHEKVSVGSEIRVLDPDDSENQNVLLKLVLEEIKKVFLQAGGELKDNYKVKTQLETIKEPTSNLLGHKLPEFSKMLFNTTIMDEPKPTVFSIDLENIVAALPEDHDNVKITKIFVNSEDDVNTEDDNAVDLTKGAISKLELIIRPNSAEIDFKADEKAPIAKVIHFKNGEAKADKIINLEIDKLKETALVLNLSLENVRDKNIFPQKVDLRFSEPKPPSTNLVVDFIQQSNVKTLEVEQFNDFTHVGVIKNSKGNEISSQVGSPIEIHIFKPPVQGELITRQPLNFVGADELTEGFAENLVSRLNSLVSGEFENRQMLNNLRSSINKNEAISNLDDNLRLPISDILTAVKRKTKTRLMVSTADVVSYRDPVNSREKPAFDFQWLSVIGNKEANLDDVMIETKQNIRMNRVGIDTSEPKLVSGNLIERPGFQVVTNPAEALVRQNTPNIGQNSAVNSLNLYEAQFSSRLGMLLADQIAKGTENFELQLEPESFGKVRVNVYLESSNVEVKMVAENSAAVMALRGTENILQLIAEQNGLKLSEYSVDMQNSQNGDNTNRKDGSSSNEDEVVEALNEADDENTSTISDNEYKLNLLA